MSYGGGTSYNLFGYRISLLNGMWRAVNPKTGDVVYSDKNQKVVVGKVTNNKLEK